MSGSFGNQCFVLDPYPILHINFFPSCNIEDENMAINSLLSLSLRNGV